MKLSGRGARVLVCGSRVRRFEPAPERDSIPQKASDRLCMFTSRWSNDAKDLKSRIHSLAVGHRSPMHVHGGS